jgi:putative transposase
VIEATMDEFQLWQNRPLERSYPIMYIDGFMVKVKDEYRLVNKEIYLALAITLEGQKELLGMWVTENQGVEFWLAVCTDLSNRGMQDCFIACIDGLTGFSEALGMVFPQTQIQLCLVQMMRHSLKYVHFKQRKEIARDLKRIYTAATLDDATLQFKWFAEKWKQQSPAISQFWQLHWEQIIPLFALPQAVRCAICTTNAIESVNSSLRQVTQVHRIFPSDEAIYKVLYLALQPIMRRWTVPMNNWKMVLNWLALAFSERIID